MRICSSTEGHECVSEVVKVMMLDVEGIRSEVGMVFHHYFQQYKARPDINGAKEKNDHSAWCHPDAAGATVDAAAAASACAVIWRYHRKGDRKTKSSSRRSCASRTSIETKGIWMRLGGLSLYVSGLIQTQTTLLCFF